MWGASEQIVNLIRYILPYVLDGLILLFNVLAGLRLLFNEVGMCSIGVGGVIIVTPRVFVTPSFVGMWNIGVFGGNVGVITGIVRNALFFIAL